MRFGWNPVSRHRKIVMNRLRPVIEKRLREKHKLGDNYIPHVSKIIACKSLYNFILILYL
jgi:hypothetical protein